ncbi:alpha-galactosidase [Chitinophaga sp. YIM B06452]|uniref:alpha-galactosidase n=1 Tax=Chitinophaga sp. YIM B06452 TaxID=3082158 RepID=UPI0031FE4661
MMIHKKLALIAGCMFASATCPAQQQDWLVNNTGYKAAVTENGNNLTISNGLLSRSFVLGPNVACTDFRNLSSGEQLLRAVKPEARLTLNGKTFNVGGLYGQPQQAYLLPAWLKDMKNDAAGFQYASHTVTPIRPYVHWHPRLWALNKQQPSGKMLTFIYTSGQPELKGVRVLVHYELYDGIPLVCKWLSIENASGGALQVNQVVNEVLATVEEESAVVGEVNQMATPHNIYIESNYAFNNAMKASLSDQTTHWKADSTYRSQVNYNYTTPCLLEVYPVQGVNISMAPGGNYSSIRTYELLLDSYDRERNGLAQRAMYRTIAPWTTQNPIFMHLVSSDPERVKSIIDQCAATGYEGVILSFGSNLNMEDTSAANIRKFKELADYAHAKNVLLGGYSLFSSRRISDEDDVIDPKTGKPGGALFGGHAPCLGSKWGNAYLQKLKYFITRTGFDIFENDGPYPGDVCASTTHPGHKGLDDSQWTQMEQQKKFYRELNEMGVYINAPDWYFLDGTHKIAIGYRETNFSLPREQQVILNRQNIYDGTWEKTPSMGWGFVPLTQYHGGGADATLEPLKDHLHAYENLMMQYYGAGVQACYRGPRLYDTNATKALVQQVVGWYKKYRDILNADIIHLRRADGREWDGILHADPKGKYKGLAMLYNPLTTPITREVVLPLYYTGLDKTASIREKEGTPKQYTLNRQYEALVKVTIPAQGYTWLVVE